MLMRDDGSITCAASSFSLSDTATPSGFVSNIEDDGDILVMVDTLAYIPDPGLEPDMGPGHDCCLANSLSPLVSRSLEGQ